MRVGDGRDEAHRKERSGSELNLVSAKKAGFNSLEYSRIPGIPGIGILEFCNIPEFQDSDSRIPEF